MAAIKMILAVSLAVLLFVQIAMCLPSDRWARSAQNDDGVQGALKSVEAKTSVAINDLQEGLNSLFQNMTAAIQKIRDQPEASKMYSDISQNINSGMAELMKSLSAMGATAAPASA